MDELQELLEEVADTGITTRTRPFNQPNLIAISSVNKSSDGNNETLLDQTGFFNFTAPLPIPALDMKSIQLLSTNIPQSNQSIPNTACVFWYYRLSKYKGNIPSIDNLYYVRLLPTTYKKEYITSSNLYGYNKTFNNYSAVSTELVKACQRDLLLDNLTDLNIEDPLDFPLNNLVPFLPNDVSITYDASVNKFKMTGLNTEVAFITWNDDNLYNVGDVVKFNETQAFKSIRFQKGVGLPFNNIRTLPVWTAGTVYVIGDVVVDANNVVYQRIADGGDYNLTPSANLTKYQSIGHSNAVASYPMWVATTTNTLGQAVRFNGIVYVLYATGQNPAINPSLQPLFYKPLTERLTRSSFWVRVYVDIVEDWVSTTLYTTGVYVAYQNVLYFSSQASINSVPTAFQSWGTENTDITNWYNYLITGYDDPNVAKLSGELFDVEWNVTRTYNTDNVVNYQGQSYIALAQNVAEPPISEWNADRIYQVGDKVLKGVKSYECILLNRNLDPSLANAPDFVAEQPYFVGDVVFNVGVGSYVCIKYDPGSIFAPNNDEERWTFVNVSASTQLFWTEIVSTYWAETDETYKTGLYGLTKLYDMTEINTNTGNILINFPFGVGGQPYNPNPKRLLNSILGFTWNGAFNPLDFGNIVPNNLTILTNTKFPLLYNHLRPIPEYLVSRAIPQQELGVEEVPVGISESLTYTADSYACLVYSSVISIYADVVGASSVDTQRTSKLLAITSVNCGNLGVAFWSNYIDNPLMKVSGDIYSIYIEFRDEFGEPYYLSNNAVATLTFKASY